MSAARLFSCRCGYSGPTATHTEHHADRECRHYATPVTALNMEVMLLRIAELHAEIERLDRMHTAVAWMTTVRYVCGEGITKIPQQAERWREAGYDVTPLYARPPATLAERPVTSSPFCPICRHATPCEHYDYRATRAEANENERGTIMGERVRQIDMSKFICTHCDRPKTVCGCK